MKKIIFLLLAAILAVGAVNAQETKKLSKKQKKELMAKQVQQKLDSRNFRIVVDRTVNTGFDNGRRLTGTYFVEMNGNNIISALPYFGQSDGPMMGGSTDEDYLRFSTKLQAIEVQPKKKDLNVILFQVTDHGREYIYKLEVYDNAKATVEVYVNASTCMGFSGELLLQVAEQ